MLIQNESGVQFQIPDGSSPQDIDDVLQHYQSQQSYPMRVANDIGQSINKGADLATSGLDPISGALQAGSQGVNAALSPIKEAIPDAIAKPIAAAGSYASNLGSGISQGLSNAVDSTSGGQKLGDYMMNSPNLQKGMQTTSDDAKALANILTVSPAGKATESVTKLAGEPIYQSGKAAAEDANLAHIQDMVMPKETPTVKAENALNTRQINGTNEYQLPNYEQKVVDTVAQVPGTGNKASYQKNLDLVQDADLKAARSLKNDVALNNAPVKLSDLSNKFLAVKAQLEANPALVGSTKESVDKISDLALKHLNNNSLDASGVLQARKDFDAEVKGYKPKVFNSEIGSAMQDATLAYRKAMNQVVADAVPNVDVIGSLQKQSMLKDAAKNISVKAGNEAATRTGRLMQKVMPHSVGEAAGDAGKLAALGAAYHYLPPSALAAGVAGYGGYKAVTSPTTRMMLGKALGGGK